MSTPSALAWAPRRLLSLELRELFEYGRPRGTASGWSRSTRFVVPAGRHVLRWRLWQRRVDAAPDSWEASARLVDTLAGGLDGDRQVRRARVPPGSDAAPGAVADLLDAEQSQVSLTAGEDDGPGSSGLRSRRDALSTSTTPTTPS